ncbi:MAG: hypothetical protein KA479_10485 [Saprospiraceae bacterium]|nr:hypothetical protein [Saprospiraceae bacterium]
MADAKGDYYHEQYGRATNESMKMLGSPLYMYSRIYDFCSEFKDAEDYNNFISQLDSKETRDSLLTNGGIQFTIKTLEKQTEIVLSSLRMRYKEAFNEELPDDYVPDIDSMMVTLGIPESEKLDFALLLSLEKVIRSSKQFCNKMNEYNINGVCLTYPDEDYPFSLLWYRPDFVYFLDSLFVNNTYIPVRSNPIMIASNLLTGDETYIRMIKKNGWVQKNILFKEEIRIIIEENHALDNL